MPSLRTSSEHSGSIHHSPKTSLHTKNDPNLALYEAQPSESDHGSVLVIISCHINAIPVAVNNQPAQDVFSLRSIQHRDRDGQIIGMISHSTSSITMLICLADPDRSNPTRSRFERPLDTIRNFEAAIEANRRQR